LVPIQLGGSPPDWFYDVDSDDEGANFGLPPLPETEFLDLAPGSPPVGWEQTDEKLPNEVPLAEDLQRMLERLRIQWEQEDRGTGSRWRHVWRPVQE
jgi:hypothetical protein